MHLFPPQPCPANTASFKQQQCSSFNAKAFGKRYYHWMPLYPGGFSQLHTRGEGWKTPTGSSGAQESKVLGDERGMLLAALGWSEQDTHPFPTQRLHMGVQLSLEAQTEFT